MGISVDSPILVFNVESSSREPVKRISWQCAGKKSFQDLKRAASAFSMCHFRTEVLAESN